MRCYLLNVHSVGQLTEQYGAVRIPEPEDFSPPDGQCYLCVLESGVVTAAVVCLDHDGMLACKYDEFPNRTWLLLDRAVVRGMVSPMFTALFDPPSSPAGGSA